VNQTFPTKKEAEAFATSTESAMINGTWADVRHLRSTTVGSVVERYIEEIHPIKPFGKSKMSTVRSVARDFQGVKVADLTPAMLLDYGRRKDVSPSTLTHHMTYLAQAVDMARTLWGLHLNENPVRTTMAVMSQLGMIGASKERDRRLEDGEYERLIKAAGDHWISPMIDIALHSAMRQGEIHQLLWSDIDFDKEEILIRDRKDPRNKIGNDGVIPLFSGVKNALSRAQNYKSTGPRVFGVRESASISDRFALVAKKAEVKDFRFHDLRHEAISRFFEQGLAIQEVAVISGHKTWEQLKRYTQLRPADISNKLRSDNHHKEE
tara:strand:- start:14978 stop:15943 length:966 start_codon:yes stop_codon:yes gene_type:complete